MSAIHMQSHRVLAIPELLDMIFSFLDDIENAYNAQVCKLWSTVALDVIWKEPSDLPRLFSRLVPLVEESGEYVFERLPTVADWTLFNRYASRVRKLVFAPLDSNPDLDLHLSHHSRPTIDPSRLSRRIFDDIARTRTRMDIFPNLHALIWMPYTYNPHAHKRAIQSNQLAQLDTAMRPMLVYPWDATVFMHPRVKVFAFYLPREVERGPVDFRGGRWRNTTMTPQEFTAARGYFLTDIAARMPMLATLDVRTLLRASSPSSDFPPVTSSNPEAEVPTLQDDLADLLVSLPMLHKLILPRFFFTSRIAEAAARLPNLGVVEFQYLPSQGCGWTGDLFPPTGAFTPDLSSFSAHPKSPKGTPVKARSALRLFTGLSTSTNENTSRTTTPPREDGPFPALYDLSLTATFADLATFLDSPHYNPSRLTSIYVDSTCVIETNRDVAKLAEALQENCGMLNYIALVSERDPGTVRSREEAGDADEDGEHADEAMADDSRQPLDGEEGDGSVLQCITLPTILPILALPLLTSLELTHAWPLGMSLSDIATVASSLPSLETLLLNTEPVHLHLPVSSHIRRQNRTTSRTGGQRAFTVPGLEVLSVVARRCRVLRHFGVFLDATGVGNLSSTAARRLKKVGGGDGSVPPSPVKRTLRALPFSIESESDEEGPAEGGGAASAPSLPSPALSLSFSAASPTFSPTLTRLSLGVSAISDGDADAAALYLSHVLPLGCEIDFGVTWEEGLTTGGRTGAEDEDEEMDDNVEDDEGADEHTHAIANPHTVLGAAPAPVPAHGPHPHPPSEQPISAALRAYRTQSLHLVVQARCTVWEKVAAQVPLLARLRQEERSRTRAMERELEALRAKEERRARGTEGSVTYGDHGEGVRMDLAAATATRKTSWMNLKELGREWLHL